jgi:hypothetical protein
MGVVHRDVKPDNVFVTDDGRVKLTDFGVAHVNRIDGGYDSAIAGTPGYMSPEQARGEHPDARADVFAIGAIAYELLTRRNPFGATDGLETTTILYRTTAGPEPAFDPAAGVSRAFQQVVLRALARERENRYPSAAAMRADLNTAAASPADSGSQALLAAVDDAGPSMEIAGLSGTTLEAIKERIPEKGSTPWTWGVAAGLALSVLLLLGLLVTPGMTDVALLLLAALAIGGVAWVMWRSKNTPAPPEEPMLGSFAPSAADASVPGAAPRVQVHVRDPYEDRTVSVALPAVIGRSPDVAVELTDELASRQHAMLDLRGDAIWVLDLGSRNGTYLDGMMVTEPMPLGTVSVVTIGSTEIRVVQG